MIFEKNFSESIKKFGSFGISTVIVTEGQISPLLRKRKEVILYELQTTRREQTARF